MPRLSFAFAICFSLLAQQEPEPPTLQANVPLVLAPATVTDRKGSLIDGLTVHDFVLTDGGKPRKIRMDTSDTVLAPVSMILLIQSSGISTPELSKIHSIGPMIKPLITGDRGQAAVVSYDREIQTRQEFTSDSGKIQLAIEQISPYSVKTARLIDAVLQGVNLLATRPENYRRVMLILGESRDRGSKATLASAIEKVQRAGVIVYFGTYSAQASAFTVKPEDDPSMPSDGNYIAAITELARLGKKNAADALAQSSGGRHLSFTRYSALEQVISRTGEELHGQYLLSFVPADDAGNSFRRIEVKIPSRPDAMIRVRPGYWPQK
ncbi:MAG TPA: VWA domain-containing protein [Bryobacteraceae bacterium]|nr:VWA domain-containing protein [Bryobacteraceae bacterium]